MRLLETKIITPAEVQTLVDPDSDTKIWEDIFPAASSRRPPRKPSRIPELATESIQDHCNRLFFKQRYQTRVLIDYNTACNEIRSIQTPLIVDATNPLTITRRDGTAVPASSYTHGSEGIVPLSSFPAEELVITYTAGYDPIPEPVVTAAHVTVGEWYQQLQGIGIGERGNPNAHESRVANDGTFSDAAYRERVAWYRQHPRQFLMPVFILRMLDPYIRRRI